MNPHGSNRCSVDTVHWAASRDPHAYSVCARLVREEGEPGIDWYYHLHLCMRYEAQEDEIANTE